MKHNLNKIVLFISLLLCSCAYIYANGVPEKRIAVTYGHSLRILHQYIDITLSNDYQNPESFKMKIKTQAMIYTEQNWDMNDERTRRYLESESYKKGREDSIRMLEEAAKSNIDITVDIDKDFFENLYDQLFEVNIKKLIDETKMSGPVADGSSATIVYGIRPCFITVGVGQDIKKTTGEMAKINKVILEIFEKAGLEGYYE